MEVCLVPIPFQEVDVNGVRFWCYNAGHVLGAAMVMMEIAGVKILYTGDFSRVEDRHLMAAEIPTMSPDLLITVSVMSCDVIYDVIMMLQESTYGTHVHEKREVREARFTSKFKIVSYN